MIRKRIVTFLTVLSFMLYYTAPGDIRIVEAEKKESEKQYIVGTSTMDQLEELEEEQKETGEINGNGENCLKENHMISLELTEDEAEELADAPDVDFVEEDVCVRASARNTDRGTDGVGWHKKEVKKIKKNQSEEEWNIRMIRGDQRKKEKKTKRKR